MVIFQNWLTSCPKMKTDRNNFFSLQHQNIYINWSETAKILRNQPNLWLWETLKVCLHYIYEFEEKLNKHQVYTKSVFFTKFSVFSYVYPLDNVLNTLYTCIYYFPPYFMVRMEYVKQHLKTSFRHDKTYKSSVYSKNR